MALARAVSTGSSAALEAALADPRVNVTAVRNAGLRTACKLGRLDLFERLTGLHEVDASLGCVLPDAVEGGSLPIVERLLVAGADPTLRQHEALIQALKRGRRDIFARLLTHTAYSRAESTLLTAAVDGDVVAVASALRGSGAEHAGGAGRPDGDDREAGDGLADDVQVGTPAGRDPLASRKLALRAAAAVGSAATMRLLLEDRRLVLWLEEEDDVPSAELVALAAAAGSVEATRLAMSHEQEKDPGSYEEHFAAMYPLQCAAAAGRLELLAGFRDHIKRAISVLCRNAMEWWDRFQDAVGAAAEARQYAAVEWLLAELGACLRSELLAAHGAAGAAPPELLPAAQRLPVLAAANAAYWYARHGEADRVDELLRRAPHDAVWQVVLSTAALSGYARAGDLARVRAVIDAGQADLTGQVLITAKSWVALPHLSAIKGGDEAVFALLPRCRDDFLQHRGPLKEAAEHSAVGILRRLLADDRCTPAQIRSALWSAARGGCHECLDALLERCEEPYAAFLAAMGQGDAAMAARLLQRPLTHSQAARIGGAFPLVSTETSTAALELLLSQPGLFDLRAHRGFAIVDAVDDGNPAAIRVLLQDERVGAPEDDFVRAMVSGRRHNGDRALYELLSAPRVLLTWPLPPRARMLVLPALTGAAWARRRAAVMARHFAAPFECEL